MRNWTKLGWDWTMLALESHEVIVLRMAKLSLGGSAALKEANRMVSEKVIALGQAAGQLAGGGSAHSVLKKYRKTVRSNRRRLAR